MRSRDGVARASAPQCASARAAPTATLTSVAALWLRRSVIQSIAFTQLSKSEKGGLTWHSLGGKNLEPALLSGAIRLLDIAWLVDLAARGGVLSRRQACCREGRAGLLGSRDHGRALSMRRATRQELPREAFVTVDQLRSATRIQDEGLRILVLSYGWMTRLHPDPLGENLQRLAGVFALYSRTLGIHGVFWDFASLMQHSAEPGGPRRTEEEEKLFQAGLAASSDFYAHPNTTVLRLTTFPSGYPEKYSDHISTSNSAEYFDRGWCYSEHCWSSLTKSVSKSLDLGHYSGNRTRLYGANGVLAECTREGARPPPLLPAQFAEELESRSFIDPSNDKPLVISLYTKIFEAKVRPRATFSAPALGTFSRPDGGWRCADGRDWCARLPRDGMGRRGGGAAREGPRQRCDARAAHARHLIQPDR